MAPLLLSFEHSSRQPLLDGDGNGHADAELDTEKGGVLEKKTYKVFLSWRGFFLALILSVIVLYPFSRGIAKGSSIKSTSSGMRECADPAAIPTHAPRDSES